MLPQFITTGQLCPSEDAIVEQGKRTMSQGTEAVVTKQGGCSRYLTAGFGKKLGHCMLPLRRSFCLYMAPPSNFDLLRTPI